jgi:filamentous hemagglutinin
VLRPPRRLSPGSAAERGDSRGRQHWIAQAKTLLERIKVEGKWAYISGKQDVLTSSGVGMGLAEAGWSDVKGLAEFLSDPVTGLKGLREIIVNPDARQKMGDAMFAELDAKITRMQEALEHGGNQNAVQFGKDLGEVIWQVGSVAVLAGTAAKAGVALGKAGISVGSKGQSCNGRRHTWREDCLYIPQCVLYRIGN